MQECIWTSVALPPRACRGRQPPAHRHTGGHHRSGVVDNRLYDLRLTDCPAISQFPSSSLHEWTDEYRGYGLRQAAAYVLVHNGAGDYLPATCRLRARVASAVSSCTSPGEP